MEEKDILLFEQILDGKADEVGLRLFKHRMENDRAYAKQFYDYKQLWHATHHFHPAQENFEMARSRFITYLNNQRKSRNIRKLSRVGMWLSVAAAVGLFVFIVNKPLLHPYRSVDSLEQATIGKPSQKAQLILASGQNINVGEQQNAPYSGTGATPQLMPGVRNEEGLLDFSEARSVVEQQATVRIPRGGYYSVRLSDGSCVMLNSASELIFPTKFAGKVRQVFLKGEAYFDVTHDAARQFVVSTEKGVDIIVHGTSFNVNAYRPDHVRATLVNGSIDCRLASGKTVRLKSGQMVDAVASASSMGVNTVDPYLYTAWKDGKFVFDNETIEEIMQRLSVWYNFKVEYANDAVRRLTFTGILSRNDDYDEILRHIAETTAVHFSVSGNTVYVR